jgi:hypothetical protein
VTQPFNQRAHCDALGELDDDAGEFWMENPWQVGEHNLSAFERNRVLLNVRAKDGLRKFVDVSHLTTADLDSDSRAVASGDFNGDGMPDLLVRSSGGGPIRVFENRWPKTNWLKVSLRGRQSNSLGLGAKLKLLVDGRTIWRELHPVSSYLCQQPNDVHFGLGGSSSIESLTIYWPSGKVQEFKELESNRHLLIDEEQKSPQLYSARKVAER